MRLTREDLAMLERKTSRPGVTTSPGELLAVFVRGRVANPLNGTPWVWQKRSRYAKAWKERVAVAVYESINSLRAELLLTTRAGSLVAKRVTFLAHTWNAMDTDGLEAALKPVRDALVECGVISGDAPSDGHEFVYAQRIDRANRGVEIRVSMRADAPTGADS